MRFNVQPSMNLPSQHKRDIRRAIAYALVLLSCALSIYLSLLVVTLNENLARLEASTAKRITTLEVLVSKRETADPLTPIECTTEGMRGESREHPCYIYFHRLLETPQQFEGRWVCVTGLYFSGFEASAFFATPDDNLVYGPDAPRPGQKQTELHVDNWHKPALWLTPGFPPGKPFRRMSVVGRFKRGPSGHLGHYFGELTDTIER